MPGTYLAACSGASSTGVPRPEEGTDRYLRTAGAAGPRGAAASWAVMHFARASEGCCFTRTAFGSYLRAIVLNWSRQNGSAMVRIGLAKVVPNTDASISTITASGFLYSWLGIIMIVSSTISSAPCSRIDATRSSRPAG